MPKLTLSRIFLPLALVTALATPSGAVTHYVPVGFARVTDALGAAGPGDTIRVAAGTYSTTANGEVFPLSLNAAVHLIGDGHAVTTLDAEGAATVITVSAAPGGHVEGFTLTGGVATDGGGILVTAGAPEIAWNRLQSNGALNSGSGIHVTGGANPWIHHNVIWESFDTDLVHSGDPHGIQIIFGDGLIEHNLIGRGDSNGLFIQQGSAPVVRNNIFYQNGMPGVRGRGICAFGDSATVIAHNLFWENEIASLVVPDNPFTDVTAQEANDLDPNDGIYGNIDGDPQFVDPDNADWNLVFGSVAIDNGDPVSALDPDSTTADIGPYYFDQSTSGVGPVPREALLRVSPNAPNPFSASTVFGIDVPAGGRVTVTILDAQGRLVKRLAVAEPGEGAWTLSWDGRTAGGLRANSGVYFVRAEWAGRSATRKLTLAPR